MAGESCNIAQSRSQWTCRKFKSSHVHPAHLYEFHVQLNALPTASTAASFVCLSVCLQTNWSQVVSSTAPPFRNIPQAAQQQVLLRGKHVASSIPNSIKDSAFQCSLTACFAFTPNLPPGKLHPIPTIATSSAVSISISWAAKDRRSVSLVIKLCIYHLINTRLKGELLTKTQTCSIWNDLLLVVMTNDTAHKWPQLFCIFPLVYTFGGNSPLNSLNSVIHRHFLFTFNLC